MIIGVHELVRFDDAVDEDGHLGVEVKDRHGWISRDDAKAAIEHLNKIYGLGYDISKSDC